MSKVFFLSLLLLCKTGETQFYHKDIAIIYDDENFFRTHSVFTDIIKDYSRDGVDFLSVTNSTGKIVEYNRLMYNHIVIVVNRKTKWSAIEPQILEFADLGGNIFFIAGSDAGRETSRLIEEFGFLDKTDHILIDHTSSISDTRNANKKIVIVDSNKYGIKSKPIFASDIGSIKYTGRGFDFLQDNPYTFPILRAPETSILTRTDESYNKNSVLAGTAIVLVGGVEMRNSARMILVGSNDLFCNDWLFGGENSQTGNMKLLFSLSKWVFKNSGVLRIKHPIHLLVSTQKTLDEYIVENEIEYSICIEELKNGVWKPFIRDDLQLELYRLTTFGRVTYNYTKDCVYKARFYLPDYIGTFRLKTDFKYFGYTTLNHEVKIIIRPRRHNDYQRFIFGAYPYYLTSFLMMIMAFSLVFSLINQKSQKEKIA